ncbi:MAG TPA: hypothetical protein VK861_10370 [Bacteroidales bacterium]|nr:hypothetical protein [Bacteroidales bacterium]
MNPFEDNLRNLVDQTLSEPESLISVEERFEKRLDKERRNNRIKISSAVTGLLVLFMFITANTDTAWAESIRKIPVLKEFLSAMQLGDDYREALEELGIASDNGEYQMYLQYALSDDKTIHLYFEASENIQLDDYDQLKIEDLKIYDLKTGKDYAPHFHNRDPITARNLEDHYFSLMGMLSPGSDENFPDTLGIEFSAVIYRGTAGSGDEYYKVLSSESLGQFSFEIKLEHMIRRPKNDINEPLNLLENTLILRSLETSTLSSVLLFEEDKDNQHRIVSIRGRILDAKTGKVIRDNLTYQIFSTVRPEYGISLDLSDMDQKSGKLELIIDGVQLLDQEKEYITLDPSTKTIDKEMENIELTSFSTGYKTLVIFKIREGNPEHRSGSLFHYRYETDKGDIKVTPRGNHQNYGEYSAISYIFDDDIDDKIILRRNGNEMPVLDLEEPIHILIDVPEEFEPMPSPAP